MSIVTVALTNRLFLLVSYVLNRGWVDKEANKIPSYNEVVDEEVDSDEDEEYLDKVDRFESAYNFRFEEE